MGSIVVLKQMVMIFALIILGYFMYKRKFVSEMVMKDLSAIVVNICCPAMILASVFQDMSDFQKKCRDCNGNWYCVLCSVDCVWLCICKDFSGTDEGKRSICFDEHVWKCWIYRISGITRNSWT